ncbi:heme exporter protein CcmD [Stappia sp. 28M-7]|jgi:heme exporter protein D|uniref:heme exporter protein CcmD n=1 Tax=Stappia sp. 28M-7 TaxID=2762596 RepID=UPI000E713A4F|nr:heme exporter protein CcmD [Stappia sp. 28M-7]MBC2861318.1 heme exporter protein CcmD [Stappia sp. 28M-7]
MTELLDLGPHAGFILTCYAITAATIVGLFVWLAADRASLTASLAKLEADGVRRRSAASSSGER